MPEKPWDELQADEKLEWLKAEVDKLRAVIRKHRDDSVMAHNSLEGRVTALETARPTRRRS